MKKDDKPSKISIGMNSKIFIKKKMFILKNKVFFQVSYSTSTILPLNDKGIALGETE